MKVTEEGSELLDVASNLKNDVKAIQSKLHTHSLLIEAIDATNAENVKMIRENSQRFMSVVFQIRKDPRNKVIILLAVIVVIMSVYLLKF